MKIFTQWALSTVEMLLFGPLQSMAPMDLNRLFVIIGRTFGPPGTRHFSELSAEEQNELFTILPILKERHEDWLMFKWLKYWQTLYIADLPPMTEGNAPDQKPIPDKGFWWYGDGYFTLQTLQGVHIRAGFRPEDVWTGVYQQATGSHLWLMMLSAAVKKYA